jgi:sulfopyruvate decarboxylase TPP-binding subunit
MSKDNEIEALIELLETTQDAHTLWIAAESLGMGASAGTLAKHPVRVIARSGLENAIAF